MRSPLYRELLPPDSLTFDLISGGGRGIRTPERVTPLTVFKTAAFSRSAIPPSSILPDWIGAVGRVVPLWCLNVVGKAAAAHARGSVSLPKSTRQFLSRDREGAVFDTNPESV